MSQFRGTTIIAVRRDGQIAMAGDGQVTFGENTIIKHGARKIRKLYNNSVLVGFAGAAGDAFALFERFEGKLEEFHGHLDRAAVELVKEWRTDRAIRNLDALIIAADAEKMLLISGSGDVIEPDDDVIAIGSGGPYALAAAKALINHSNMSAGEIARQALEVAASICVYTNNQIYVVELTKTKEASGSGVDS